MITIRTISEDPLNDFQIKLLHESCENWVDGVSVNLIFLLIFGKGINKTGRKIIENILFGAALARKVF